MSDPKIWFPLYIGDYLADTISLSKAEHGSYMLSIMAYWRKGGPLSMREMRSVCGKEFDVVSHFYTYQDGHFFHKRIDEEIAVARGRMDSAREKAMKGVMARLNKKEASGGQ